MELPRTVSSLPINPAPQRRKKSAVTQEGQLPRLFVDLFVNDLLINKISDNMTQVLKNLRKQPSSDNEMEEIVNNTRRKMTAINDANLDSESLYRNILQKKKEAIKVLNTSSEWHILESVKYKRRKVFQ